MTDSPITTECEQCRHQNGNHRWYCIWHGCRNRGQTVKPADPTELDRVAVEARRKALTEAWQAVDRAIRPLGYGGGATNSPWNRGYEQAKNEALNAILILRDEVKS